MKPTRLLSVLALLALATPALAAPPEPAPQHGGRLLPAGSAVFEVVHDPDAGTLTLYATKRAGGVLDLGRAPTYVLAATDGKQQELALVALPDVKGAWRATDLALKAKRLTGTVQVLVDDAPQTLRLGETALDRQEGLLLFGGDALRLRFRAHAHDGTLELTTVNATDALALGKETPQVFVTEGGRDVPLTLTLRTDVQDAAAWTVRDVAAVKAAGTLRVRAKVGTKTYEAPIHLTNDETVGVHGGRILTFGEGVARVEVVHDAAAGTLAFHALAVPADPKAWKPESVDVRLATNAAATYHKAGPVADCICVWLLRAPELREPVLKGTVRVKAGEQVWEAQLEGGPKAKEPPPQEPAAAEPVDGANAKDGAAKR